MKEITKEIKETKKIPEWIMAGNLYNQVKVEHESQRKWIIKEILDKEIMVGSDVENDSILNMLRIERIMWLK